MLLFEPPSLITSPLSYITRPTLPRMVGTWNRVVAWQKSPDEGQEWKCSTLLGNASKNREIISICGLSLLFRFLLLLINHRRRSGHAFLTTCVRVCIVVRKKTRESRDWCMQILFPPIRVDSFLFARNFTIYASMPKLLMRVRTSWRWRVGSNPRSLSLWYAPASRKHWKPLSGILWTIKEISR